MLLSCELSEGVLDLQTLEEVERDPCMVIIRVDHLSGSGRAGGLEQSPQQKAVASY